MSITHQYPWNNGKFVGLGQLESKFPVFTALSTVAAQTCVITTHRIHIRSPHQWIAAVPNEIQDA
jgi:hypothetical protein